MWLKWKHIFGFVFLRSQNHILMSWPAKLNAIRRLNPSLRLKCVSGRGGDARETSCNYYYSYNKPSKLVTRLLMFVFVTLACLLYGY